MTGLLQLVTEFFGVKSIGVILAVSMVIEIAISLYNSLKQDAKGK